MGMPKAKERGEMAAEAAADDWASRPRSLVRYMVLEAVLIGAVMQAGEWVREGQVAHTADMRALIWRFWLLCGGSIVAGASAGMVRMGMRLLVGRGPIIGHTEAIHKTLA